MSAVRTLLSIYGHMLIVAGCAVAGCADAGLDANLVQLSSLQWVLVVACKALLVLKNVAR